MKMRINRPLYRFFLLISFFFFVFLLAWQIDEYFDSNRSREAFVCKN